MRFPIFYGFGNGQILHADLTLQSGAINVCARTLDGAIYSTWTLPSQSSNLGRNEFVAATWGDHFGLMSSAMFSTGWFERSGKTACIPECELNEIWRLTPAAEEWLARSAGCLVEIPVSDLVGTPLQMSEAMFAAA